jgi:hypothetical protein
MKLFVSLLCLFLSDYSLFAQSDTTTAKVLKATRTTGKINIDGILNDEAWKAAPAATDFVEWRPAFGLKEDRGNRTEIRILYDNNAIYISGYVHETSADSITKELVGRDVVGVNDFIGVIFDTYHDKINGFGYYVTPLGEQFDAKYSSDGEDGSWNSVYETSAKILNDGWVFEMRIPYAAIRFGNSRVQDWGINITRRRNKSGKQLMWHPVDPKIGGNFLAQFGTWAGIQDIKAPIRLSFSPYLSTYANHYPYNTKGINNTTTSINGGMDVKYGINQAFTLDMTLIPDFGQVQSDNQVLNLTPFEVRFNENRTFFTEGTELFGKGNLFYSRRIGGQPLHYWDVQAQLQPGETIAKNPSETKLINASKISGRTQAGLGIGFFNAITNPQYAIIENGGKESRRIETSPLTNYNIIVFDQTLKNNSSISLINTNVTRAGADYDANITAGLWDLFTKGNKWNFSGKAAVSRLLGYNGPGQNLNGYSHSLTFAKRSGRFNFEVSQDFADNKYNHNDMGYFTNNNYMDNSFWMGYRFLEPKKWYNRININMNGGVSMRYKPWDFQNSWLNANVNGQLKNLWWAGINFNVNAFENNDFYEPRVEGRVFRRPASIGHGFWVETNRAKKYSATLELFNRFSNRYNSNGQDYFFGNQYRFNQKLTISINSSVQLRHNNLGFATMYSADSIIFAQRKRTTVENLFNVKYNFNNKMGITFRARHYWSKVQNQSYFTLQTDGGLKSIVGGIDRDVNFNVNYFNIDMVYTWQFALGSFINIVWKDAITTFNRDVRTAYLKNLGTTVESAQQNSLSIRVIYFLDYLSLKKHKVS